jgi:hypothetical protein
LTGCFVALFAAVAMGVVYFGIFYASAGNVPCSPGSCNGFFIPLILILYAPLAVGAYLIVVFGLLFPAHRFLRFAPKSWILVVGVCVPAVTFGLAGLLLGLGLWFLIGALATILIVGGSTALMTYSFRQ